MNVAIPGWYLAAAGSETLFSMAPDDWQELHIHLSLRRDVVVACEHLVESVRSTVLAGLRRGALVAQGIVQGGCHVIIAGPQEVIQPTIDLCRSLWESTSGRLIFAPYPSGEVVDCNYDISTPSTWSSIILQTKGVRERDLRRLMKRIEATESGLALLRGGDTRALVGEVEALRAANRRIKDTGAAISLMAGGAQ